MTDTDPESDGAQAPRPEAPQAEAQQSDAPLTRSLAFLLRQGGRRVPAPGAPPPSSGRSEEDEADLILRALAEKMVALSDTSAVLRRLLRTTGDPTKFDRITRKRNAAIFEYNLCDARYSAIDHGGPFRPLPHGEEERLVAAIQAVSDCIADTQRWEALLQALDSLVKAFAAKKTDPAASQG